MNCLPGTAGSRPSRRFSTEGCRSHTAALVRGFEPARYIEPLKLRRIDEVGRLALVACRLAAEDARLPTGDRRGRRRARQRDGRPAQHRPPPARPRDDGPGRRAGPRLQQHDRQRRGQPLRHRVRVARAQPDARPEAGLGARGDRVRRRRCWSRAAPRRSSAAASTTSRRRSSASTIGFACCRRPTESRKRAGRSMPDATASSWAPADMSSCSRRLLRGAAGRGAVWRDPRDRRRLVGLPAERVAHRARRPRAGDAGRARRRRRRPRPTSPPCSPPPTPRGCSTGSRRSRSSRCSARTACPWCPSRARLGEYGAVGAASLIAALLCLRRGVLPPTLGCEPGTRLPGRRHAPPRARRPAASRSSTRRRTAARTTAWLSGRSRRRTVERRA